MLEFSLEWVSSTDKAAQVTSIIKKKELKMQYSRSTQTPVLDSCCLPLFKFADRQFKAFCGTSKNVAQLLSLLIGSQIQDGHALSRESKITLMLVKLKLNCSFTALSGFYGISDSLARKVFFPSFRGVD